MHSTHPERSEGSLTFALFPKQAIPRYARNG